MAFSLIASTSKASTSGTAVTTAAVNTTGANLLVLWVSNGEDTGAVVTDNKANTWVPVIARPATGAPGSRIALWAALNPTVGTGHTVTATGTLPNVSFEAYATGLTVASVDTSVGTSATVAVSSLATGTLTPAGNNELLVTATAYAGAAATGVNASYTIVSAPSASVASQCRGLGTAYQVQTTGTARNATWTLPAATSSFAVAQAAFTVLSAGTGTLTVSKATVPAGSPQPFTFDAFATSAATLYTASGVVTTVNHPSWSADGALVVFAATGSSPGIYSIHSDGTNLTRLTTTSGDDYPRFNPAGDRIVYQSLDTGVYQVFIMHTDGSAQTKLTAIGGSSGTYPTYNAAGDRIYYTKTVTATGAGTWWNMHTDGTVKTQILSMSPNNITQAQLSPAGTYILALVTGTGAGVYRMLADTTAQTQLPIAGTATDMGWAPDTTGFAFTLNGSTVGWLSAAGVGQTTVYNAVVSSAPAYDVTGKILVFAGSTNTTLLTLTSLVAPALFTLTDGTSRSFVTLTAGSSYRLAETAVSGWSTVYTVSNGSISAITIAANATTTVLATNTFSSPSTTVRKIRRWRQGPYVTDAQNHYRVFQSRAEILIKAGVGNSDAPNPTLTLQWSDDYGSTWSTGIAMSMGTAGQALKRLFVPRLGSARDRVYRVWTDDPVDVAIVDAFLWADVGTS